MTELVVVTDLDGTLLDHHSYRWDDARPALAALAARHIPVVLNSSKTRAEMRPLQAQLALDAPFISENGAIIDWGDGSSRCFAKPRQQLLAVLAELRQQGFKFSGFADWCVEDIAQQTGLSLAQAKLAADREFTEPLCWQGSAGEQQAFLQALAKRQLQAQQGGRFLTVMGQYSKGQAMAALRQHYPGAHIIALGDSANDLSMLNGADTAVVVASANSDSLTPTTPTIRTQQPGPAGWNRAILDWLTSRS